METNNMAKSITLCQVLCILNSKRCAEHLFAGRNTQQSSIQIMAWILNIQQDYFPTIGIFGYESAA